METPDYQVTKDGYKSSQKYVFINQLQSLMCDDCGCIVGDIRKHDDFHRTFYKVFETVQYLVNRLSNI